MTTVPPSSLDTNRLVKMMAILEQWDVTSGCHTDNTEKFLLLLLFKFVLDIAIFYLCCQKLRTSFLSMCSLSIILADFAMVFFMATVWLLGAERSLVSPCFLLANASTTYGALPLPMMVLGLSMYCLDPHLSDQTTYCKFLRNVALTLLVWMLAVIHSFGFAKADLMELDYVTGVKALVCNVEESTVITYFIWGVFTAVICTMLPFWSKIPRWVREADMLIEIREKQMNQGSDLLFTSTDCTKPKCGEEKTWQQPPLWLSLTVAFSLVWLPYLAVSAVCLLFGLGVPAYITVNLLWLECTNSLLAGVVFWARSKTAGPYSHLPENVCSWQVYWYLSQGAGQQPPIAVFNPSKGKRNPLFYNV